MGRMPVGVDLKKGDLPLSCLQGGVAHWPDRNWRDRALPRPKGRRFAPHTLDVNLSNPTEEERGPVFYCVVGASWERLRDLGPPVSEHRVRLQGPPSQACVACGVKGVGVLC